MYHLHDIPRERPRGHWEFTTQGYRNLFINQPIIDTTIWNNTWREYNIQFTANMTNFNTIATNTTQLLRTFYGQNV